MISTPTIDSMSPSRRAAELALAAEVLKSFGELRFVARGGSMLPSILPGDKLLIRREGLETMRPGQVALCRRDGAFCAHRVKFKEKYEGNWFLYTAGDALEDDDWPIAEEDVLGRVFAVVRRGKYIDVTESRSLGVRAIEWAVKHSDAFAVFFLRCHALRMRVADRFAGTRLASRSAHTDLTECQ